MYIDWITLDHLGSFRDETMQSVYARDMSLMKSIKYMHEIKFPGMMISMISRPVFRQAGRVSNRQQIKKRSSIV